MSIASPPHGAQVPLGQEVLVLANASDPNGILRVELWVDSTMVAMAQPASSQTSYSAVLRWTHAAPGTPTLAVRAINTANVASDVSAVAVVVVSQSAPTLAAPPTVPAPAAVPPTTTPVTPAACANDAVFVEHVTVPDGTDWNAGQTFNKIWRVRNSGTCTWASGYELAFVGGEAMTTSSTALVPHTAPGATADFLVAMTAPNMPGTHSGQWRLRHSSAGLFGATLNVSINVLGAAAQPPPPAACPGPPAIASFEAKPSAIVFGQTSTLEWGLVSNATSATIDQGIGGVVTPSSVVVKPGTDTTYTLTAIGCGGTVSKQVTVQVKPLGMIIGTIVVPTLPIGALLPKGDLSVQDMYLSATGNEIIFIVATSPTGSLTGTFNYEIKAVKTSMIVKSGSCPIPAGSQACWTGYKIAAGSADFTVQIDSDSKIWETNENNNTMTKTLHGK